MRKLIRFRLCELAVGMVDHSNVLITNLCLALLLVPPGRLINKPLSAESSPPLDFAIGSSKRQATRIAVFN